MDFALSNALTIAINRREAWRDGMQVVTRASGTWWRRVNGRWFGNHSQLFAHEVPPDGIVDLDDDATQGCLLGMLRQALDKQLGEPLIPWLTPWPMDDSGRGESAGDSIALALFEAWDGGVGSQ